MTESTRPIFIVGSGRSGTSILTWCLGQLPHILPLPETNWISKFAVDLESAYDVGSARGKYSHLSAMGVTSAEFYETFGDAINDLTLRHPTRINSPRGDGASQRSNSVDLKRWVDGTPENSFYIPGLLRLFPHAKFIHILRDVGSVIRSLVNFSNVGGADYTEQAAYKYWLRSVRACIQAERDFGPEKVLRIRYADLLSSPEEVLRSCLSFLDEPFYAECLKPLQTKINSSNVPPDFDPYDADTDPLLRERAEGLSRRLLEETYPQRSPKKAKADKPETVSIEPARIVASSRPDRQEASGGLDNTSRANPADVSWETVSKVILKHASEEKHLDKVAWLLNRAFRSYLKPSLYPKYFRVFEEYGLHLTPVHFYYPIPDTRTLTDELWAKESALVGIDLNEDVQLHLLREVFPRFRAEYEQFPPTPTARPYEFYLNNGLFGGTDALALYCMVRHFQPSFILEVGSGFSSRVSAQAALRNGHTKLTCIEPYPDEVLRNGFPGLTSLIAKRVQEVELSRFEELGPGDILFIDSSHVVKIGGDVNYLFLEVIPRLKPGVIVHVHDIFIPFEYRRDWVIDGLRFWTEQYLLQAFLTFNSEYEVLLCNSYLGSKHHGELQSVFPNSPWWGGGSFWMRRREGS